MHTNQKEHTVSQQFERFVKPTTPAFTLFEPERFHMVPRSTATIQEWSDGRFMVEGSRVSATLDANPENLIQMASDALLLAERLRERQSALQDDKEAEKAAQEAQVEKEAKTLFEVVAGDNWDKTSYTSKQTYYRLALAAREIHGVSK